MIRFSDQIHFAYRLIVTDGLLPEASLLVDRLRNFDVSPGESDALWAELIGRYIQGPRANWALVVLEVMRVDLLELLGSLKSLPPAVTREDIAQQLIVELLSAALDGPADPARWTRHRLITRATTAVQRMLLAELKRANHLPVIPANSDPVAHKLAWAELVADVKAGRVPANALIPVYRTEVWGDSLSEIAVDIGISADALRMRQARSLDKLRQMLAA